MGYLYNLYCDDLIINIMVLEIGYWIFLFGILVEVDGYYYEIVIWFNICGYILWVINIIWEMSGVYICEIWWVDGIMWIWVLCGLNLFGLKFYYWLDKYINNFIWGVVVVVCLLVLMLFVCFV